MTNEERAYYAALAVRAYAITKEGNPHYEDMDTIIGDLICDLCHMMNVTLDGQAGTPIPEVKAHLDKAFAMFEDEVRDPTTPTV